MRRVAASLLTCSLVLPAPAPAQAPPSDEQEAADGIRQVKQGDFETAIVTLDSAVRKLEGQPGRDPLLLQALVQLGVALVGLDQVEAARARFRRALTIDKKLRLRSDTFSPKVIAVFDHARLEMETQKDREGNGNVVTPLVLAGLGAAGTAAGLALRGDEPPRPGTSMIGNGRFSPPAVVCPDGTNDQPLPFIVLVDLTAAEQGFVIEQATAEMTIVSSPGNPSEVNFISNRPAQATPDRVNGGTVATVRIDSTLLCGNGPGGPARYNEWSARLTLRSPSGEVLTTTTLPPPLRVDLP